LLMAALNLEIDALGHLTESALEEYAFQRLPEDQIELTETHLLACESCVNRLEEMETYIGAMKRGLRALQADQTLNHVVTVPSTLLRFPSLRWAAVAALLAVGVCVPVLVRNNAPTALVSLHAYRGSEAVTVPRLRETTLLIDARDLPREAVRVQVVDAFGAVVWTGTTKIEGDSARVVLPAQAKNGAYFLRVYGADSKPYGNLLREFAFDVR
jgi:hypothetical protein